MSQQEDSYEVFKILRAKSGLVEAAFRDSLLDGLEVVQLDATEESQAHLDTLHQLALEALLVSAQIRSLVHDMYLRLAEAYEKSGQPEEAQSIVEELRLLSPQ